MIIPSNGCTCKGVYYKPMNTKLFKKFIEELREQGIKVERLNLSQVSESIKLYKVLNQ